MKPSQMNANQITDKFTAFVKDLAAFGDDVLYTEKQTVGGTWDSVADRMVGGSTQEVSTLYPKSSLITPVVFRDGTTPGGGRMAFAMGHQLGDVTSGEAMICRFHANIPLTPTGVYLVGGQRWKLARLVDSYRIGPKVFWNLIQLVKA